MPGDPVSMYYQSLQSWGRGYSIEIQMQIEYYKEAFGLDKDLFTQYMLFLNNLFLKGDFGPSILNFPESAQAILLRSLPWTIGLLGTTTIISWSIGLVAGLLAGWFKDSKLSNSFAILSLILSQIPFYYLAIIILLLFAFTFHFFPSGGAYSPGLRPDLSLEFIISVLYHSILPASALVLTGAAAQLIGSRALVISILNEDYLHFAHAKGLKKGWLLYKYVLRNALLPQITALGMRLAFVINGSVLIEQIFMYPGVGLLFMQAVGVLDYNTITGYLFISATVVFGTMLLMELIYPLLDPRVKIRG
jgi:peptide/nickel transport system permease protein